MAAKRLPASTVAFTCSLCPASCTGLITDILARLVLCQACFDRRHADGMKAKRAAEEKEGRGG